MEKENYKEKVQACAADLVEVMDDFKYLCNLSPNHPEFDDYTIELIWDYEHLMKICDDAMRIFNFYSEKRRKSTEK